MKTAIMNALFLMPGTWNAFAQETAKRIPHDNPTGHVDHLAKMVESGECELLQISKDGKQVGFVVFSIEGTERREMNVVAAFAENTGADMTAEFLPQLLQFARMDRNCISLRFHTVRPGLVVKAMKQGGRVSEVVIRFNV